MQLKVSLPCERRTLHVIVIKLPRKSFLLSDSHKRRTFSCMYSNLTEYAHAGQPTSVKFKDVLRTFKYCIRKVMHD